LEARFWEHLADASDTLDSAHRKIRLLFHLQNFTCCDFQEDGQMPLMSDLDSLLALFAVEQHAVTSQIINAATNEAHQLMPL
jgi:hypothetical protein